VSRFSTVFSEPEENNGFSIITQVNIRETEEDNILYEFTDYSKEKQWKVLFLEQYLPRSEYSEILNQSKSKPIIIIIGIN
jgi:hypothetical protein